jgi:hypothetical protein
MNSLKNYSMNLPKDSKSLFSDKKPGFVKPVVKSGWNHPNIRDMPSIYILERSSRFLDRNLYEPSTILENLVHCFRILSLWVKYSENLAGAGLLSPDLIEMYVYLWKVEGGQKICVEIQRRQGDSLTFHNYAEQILNAASGDFNSITCTDNYSYFDFRYLREAEKLKFDVPREFDRKENSFQVVDHILNCVTDKSLNSRILGMKHLCTLSDVRKTRMSDASAICSYILLREGEDKFGNFHDLIFNVIQKRCMPDEERILAEMFFNYDSDDEEYFDDEDHNTDMPLEYQEALRYLMTYGLTIVANCLEVVSIVSSCQAEPDKTVECSPFGSNYVSKVLQAAQNLTDMDLLSTFLEILANGNDQPHHASEAARCLKFLCQLSSEACELVLKQNATQIALDAQRIGLATHLRLETESTELLQILCSAPHRI